MQKRHSQNSGSNTNMKKYIASVLQVPENAMRQYNRIADAIVTLDVLAERVPVMRSEPEHKRGLRRLLVDNYSVFYIIQNDKVL